METASEGQRENRSNVIPIDGPTADASGKPKKVTQLLVEKEDPPEPWVYPVERPVKNRAVFHSDYLESFIPKSGFIRDFCEARACYETSPFFLLWGALFTLADSTRRTVGLRWGESFLFPNLYVFLCAPPGTVKKATAIELSMDCLCDLSAYCAEKGDDVEAYVQEPNILSGKGTPESMTKLLAERTQYFLGANNKTVKTEMGSQGTIIVPELTTFLNTSTYNEVLVDRLTDLWDCRTRKSTEITIGRGRESVAEVYLNFFTATTPDSLRSSLPEKAFGGGFVSRVCLVYIPTPTRSVPIPYIPQGYPRTSDLVSRLYWCVKNAKSWGVKGEFALSDEANEEYVNFYHLMHDEIVKNQYTQQHAQNRLTQLVLKVAMLIRMSRYEEGTEISLEDFQLARKIMLYTTSQSKYATEDNGNSKFGSLINSIKSTLAQKPDGVERRPLLKKMTAKGAYAADLDSALAQLFYCGFLEIFSPEKADGTRDRRTTVTCVGGELYKITEEGLEEMTIQGE